MATAYKLTYFNIRGLAEVSRMLLKYGKIEFEDVRLELDTDEWPLMKDKTPFGQLPLLEHKGKTVGQSLAIARYLAKQVNLAGKDDWENLEIDAMVDTINDLRLKLVPLFYEEDEAKKKEIIDKVKKEDFSFYFPRLESTVNKNNGYLAAGRLTWADFYWATISLMFEGFAGEDALAAYPNLKAVREKVHDIPAVKKWVESRPKTPF